MIPVFVAICGMNLVFISCELGQRNADAFDGINLAIDQLNWYRFPIGIKRMLPMIITVAEMPVTMECFGSISCTREVFEKVSLEILLLILTTSFTTTFFSVNV